MLCDFKTSTEAEGLGIHPDKMKILSNQDKVKTKEITVDKIQMEILSKGDSARYLGQKITFEDQETAEIKNRLKAAWAAFHKYRQELTSKNYRLRYRLRLFNMVVTPTLTYASGTWTLTQKHEKMIKTAQKKNASPHCTNKEKIQIKMVSTNKKGEEPEMSKDKDNENISEKDTEDDSQQDSNKDQDSDVSFQEEVKNNGSNSSKEAPKKPKNIWKNTKYHAGFNYTGEQSYEWLEEWSS